MCPNPQETEGNVTEEFLNGKLHFLRQCPSLYPDLLLFADIFSVFCLKIQKKSQLCIFFSNKVPLFVRHIRVFVNEFLEHFMLLHFVFNSYYILRLDIIILHQVYYIFLHNILRCYYNLQKRGTRAQPRVL